MSKVTSTLRVAIAMAVAACSLFSDFAMAESSADSYQREYDRIMADMRTTREASKAEMAAAVSRRDSEARASATCTDMESARKTQAQAFIERHQAPDPSKVIQNSTCFSDIMDIKIPVSLTGIGWLDGMISKIANKMIQGACSKVTSYVNDLKNAAINQISSGVKGALNIGQLNIAGANVSGAVNGAINGQVDSAINSAVGQVNGAVQSAGTSLYAAQSTASYSVSSTPVSNSGAALAQAKTDYQAVQCSVSGVGSNASCPCPQPQSLPGGAQSQYPQCTATYVPWFGGS